MSKRFSLEAISWEMVRRLKANAPVRDYHVYSKYGAPGNLKNNGINYYLLSKKDIRVICGGAPAPYDPYTEYTSRKKGWHKKARNEVVRVIETVYGGKRV